MRDVLVPLKPFIYSRAIIFAILLIVPNLTSYSSDGYRFIKLAPQPISQTFKVGDVIAYQDIARNGYSEVTAAYFPLWPIVFLRGNLIVGVLLANIFFYFGLVALHSLVKDKKVIWYACFFPTSYFFSLPMSESLYFLLTVLAFSNSWWGIPASATRLVGIVLLPALVRKDWRAVFIPLGLIGYMVYLYLKFGDPLAFVSAQSHFGRTLFNYPVGIFAGWACVPLSLLSGWIWLWAGIKLIQSKEWGYAVYTLGSLVLPLMSGFTSLPRYACVVFPIFIVLAKEKVDLRVPFVIGLTLLSILFALHVVFAVA
jgi:hypothetical protein